MMSMRRSFVDALHRGVFGHLDWVETSLLHGPQQAFEVLDQGRLATAKVVLLP